MVPEHTMAGYELARSMGASFIECDVAVTADGTLVCRHSMCDLATTTDILKGKHDDLASKCSEPFHPSRTVWAEDGWPVSFRQPASVECCTYDFTYAELQRLCMTMDEMVNPLATRPEDYTIGAPKWRSQAFEESGACEKIVRHRDMAEWLFETGGNAIPELKDTTRPGTLAFMASVGRTVTDLAEQLMEELMEVGFTQTMERGSNGDGWTNPGAPKVWFGACIPTLENHMAEQSIEAGDGMRFGMASTGPQRTRESNSCGQ